ncbi:hypothetical protein D7S70_22635 [Ralstonia pickettii]|nr:hypothetical protein [Ralstonia pickettii]MBB0037267.1 hypothetical protein [Ralstonia pickettii]MBB0109601.1 hypothetical protein [Ralstonia pickettii]MBB0130581.1 hypothetical protein [Ralstonia pickettii]MBB0169360.1 hypothetical protein [Ralstonia pickettii]
MTSTTFRERLLDGQRLVRRELREPDRRNSSALAPLFGDRVGNQAIPRSVSRPSCAQQVADAFDRRCRAGVFASQVPVIHLTSRRHQAHADTGYQARVLVLG